MRPVILICVVVSTMQMRTFSVATPGHRNTTPPSRSLLAIRALALRAQCTRRDNARDRMWHRGFTHTAMLCVAYVLLALCGGASAWVFLPGITPNEFSSGEPLLVLANNLVSRRSKIPHDYLRVRYCKPGRLQDAKAQVQTHQVETSFAQLLQGERARPTSYQLHMLKQVQCENVCDAHLDAKEVEMLVYRIQMLYRARLSLDDMPIVEPTKQSETVSRKRTLPAFRLGVPLGAPVREEHSADNDAKVTVYNHLSFTVRYHEPSVYVPSHISQLRGTESMEPKYRIVGFEVTPESRLQGCDASESKQPLLLPLRNFNATTIPFTYSVQFEQSAVRWVTRFDTLMRVSHGRKKMQWFAIVNSLMLALFLTASCAAVLLRTLRRDCARYGLSPASLGDDFDDDLDDDSGWRMLRGDVFRAPRRAGLLCVLAGTGAQLVIVAAVTLLCALFGVLSPTRRGSVLSGLLASWVLSTGVAGYVAARLHKAMGGTNWKRVTVGVAFLLPGGAFAMFTMLNVMMWTLGSTSAAPVVAMLALLSLWFGVSVPLAFAGTYLGYMHKAYNFAVRTNQIPRPIPAQPWYLRPSRVYAICGLIPFGVVCLELRLILNAVWQNEFYHMFAFLTSVFIILAIVTAEVSVVLVFVKLSNSDYMWWWDSWAASAASGAYVFLYSLCYLYMHAKGKGAGSIPAQILFLSYSALGSAMFALLTGAIGFLAALAFARRIYSTSVYD